MTLRDHCNDEEIEAHAILDRALLGEDVPEQSINWAMLVLGDGIGLGIVGSI